MDFTTFLWTTFGAFLTLATFSFLYKDNPFYKFAEHLVVGVSAGYFVVILWHNALVPNLFERLALGDWYFLWLNSPRWEYIIPGILGTMMFTRFSKDYAWVSRWPMALYIGISAGLAVPLEMSNRVNKQLYATMANVDWTNFIGGGSGTFYERLLDPTAGLATLLIFIGAISALIYFFFSKAHTGAFGGVAKFGIWTLMIGFGASFGYTVMARISLFINRLQYLDQAWIQTAFDTESANFHAGYQVVFWIVVAAILGYVAREIITHLGSKSESKPAA